MANKFQSVLDADHLNERGKAIGFAKRHRLLRFDWPSRSWLPWPPSRSRPWPIYIATSMTFGSFAQAIKPSIISSHTPF
jgi:hypothetical protein